MAGTGGPDGHSPHSEIVCGKAGCRRLPDSSCHGWCESEPSLLPGLESEPGTSARPAGGLGQGDSQRVCLIRGPQTPGTAAPVSGGHGACCRGGRGPGVLSVWHCPPHQHFSKHPGRSPSLQVRPPILGTGKWGGSSVKSHEFTSSQANVKAPTRKDRTCTEPRAPPRFQTQAD